MKKAAIFVIITALLFSTCIPAAYADEPAAGTRVPKKVMFWLKPDICVELNEVRMVFKDANGHTVYPVIFNGTTYLPVRAVSSLMGEPIEWDAASKTVYIGRTLTNPVKSPAQVSRDCAVRADESDIIAASMLQPSLVSGYSKPDVTVMYDFVIQTFKDADRQTVYPLNYNGSIYLPVRAISRLMGEPIKWDAAAKKISIGDGEEEEPVEEEPDEDADAVFKQLRELFEEEEALYYEATAKITRIKNAGTEERQAIAISASENCVKAQSVTLDVKQIKDQDEFTDEEKAAYEALLAFAESNEYYILILENIAYMAANGQDYSMLAETFLYFALEAQAKLEEARDLIMQED
jgi:hypothetical protein